MAPQVGCNNTKRKFEENSASSSSELMALSVPAARRRRRKITGRRSPSVPGFVESLEEFCGLPETLRKVLDEERHYITKTGFEYPNGEGDCGAIPRPTRRVHHLPATVTVKQVLDHFQNKCIGTQQHPHNQEGNESQNRARTVETFCQALEELFDFVLPSTLLYREEVPQYKSTFLCHAAGMHRPCEVYGCQFLLRLLVRLPHLAHLHSTKSLQGALLSDLIILLQKNRQVCFRHSYREPTYKELLDWERVATCEDEPGAVVACISSHDAIIAENGDEGSDMAITPTKKARSRLP